MDELRLARYEAQGNDFLIALLTEHEYSDLDETLKDLSIGRNDLARLVCDRDLGVGGQRGYVHSKGADGFILGVYNANDGLRADHVRMHLLNADGSFAETSGNGLASLACAAADAGHIDEGQVPFLTDAGKQDCEIGPADIASKNRPLARGRYIRVTMRNVASGPEIPRELAERLPEDFGSSLLHFGTGDVGNPHLVIALTHPPISGDASDLSTRAAELGDRVALLGRTYEEYFPEGINVEFIWPLDASNSQQGGSARTLVMSVWERGAGLTVSCGSGSVVAATLARRWGLVRSPNDPPHVADGDDESDTPRWYPVGVQTAPFLYGDGLPFHYYVRTVAASREQAVSPQLRVVAERIETDIIERLDRVPALLDDLDSMNAAQR